MFKWDGSDITFLINQENIIVEEGVYDKNTYWKISTNNEKNNENNNEEDNIEYCLVRFCITILPCLIDELKTAFNLEKIGTHWIKYKGKILILLKLVSKDDIIIKDLTLDKLGYNESIRTEIQKIFVFRELLGLSQNFEKNIILRQVKKFIKPISFYEAGMNPANEGKVIPNTILDKWFENSSLDEGVKKLFSIHNKEEITVLSHKLREQMDKIVERVDKNSILNVGEIITRIISRLQYILD